MAETSQRAIRNEDFELIAESIPHIVWMADATGAANYFNRRGTDYTGLGRDANYPWDWLNLVHGDDAERARQCWEQAVATQTPFQLDYRIRRHDGEYRWHEVRADMVRDRGGAVVKWIGTATDIDDQKNATAVLEGSRHESAELATLLDTLQSCAPIGFGFVDRDFRVRRINEVLAAVNGATVEEQLGQRVGDVIPDIWRQVGPLYRQVLATGEPVLNSKITGPTSADPGRPHHWLASYYPVALQAETIGVGLVVVDVTDQEDAERALRESEARYRSIADTAREGIWTVDVAGRTQYANLRVADVLGLTLEDVHRTTVPELLDPQGRGFIADRLCSRNGRGPEEFDVIYNHPDGAVRVLHLSVSPLNDDTGAPGCLAMITDITAARRAENELRRQALHDSLTGLANRALLRDRLDHALARQRSRGAGDIAVVFTDLDQFKLINDTHGHAIGDDLLQQVAQRLRGATREGDTLARFGGDEFVVVAEDTNEEQAREIADRMLDTFVEPFDVLGQHVYVSASVGIAVSPPDNPDKLLRFADAAMYDAKARGRGRIRFFDAAVAEQTADRLALSTELREALAADALALHYQPLVELETGAVMGVEALLRWAHPVRGMVPPAQFVAVAEATGLGQALDEWVLNRACADLGRLRRLLGESASVSVNISARHLTDTDLEEHVMAALATADASAHGLILEITETALMDDPARSRAILARLQGRGMRIAIDDFGTGYSSLGYLTQLPVDILKIDRCFVDKITDDVDAFAITAAIIDLARTLRLTTVAEGVETAEQATLLRRLQCPTGQGFLWSPAVSLGDLDALLSTLSANSFPISGEPLRRPHSAARGALVTAEHGLQQIMRLHRDGASLATIAAALDADGYRTPQELHWDRTSVARAITNVAYPNL